ncbi:MAG: hypothetical protein ACFB8W_24470 [Elainellaceae cyanobacterium]
MKETQAEIQRIQARLQTIGKSARRKSPNSTQLAVAPPTETSGPSTVLALAEAQPYPEISLPGGDRHSRRATSLGSESPLLSSQMGLGYVESGTAPDAHPSSLEQPEANDHLPRAKSPAPAPKPTAAARVPSRETPRAIAAEYQQLDQQAQHVNELSSALEAALLDLRAMATQLERQHPDQPVGLIWQWPEAVDQAALEDSRIHGSILPYVERDPQGTLILKTHSSRTHSDATAPVLDGRVQSQSASHSSYLAEWRAQQVADQLRQQTALRGDYPPSMSGERSSRSGSARNVLTQTASRLGRSLGVLLSFDSAKSDMRSRQNAGHAVKAIPSTKITLQDAVLWVMGAAIARIVLDLLLASYPTLWLPIAAMVVTPAAIAIYCTAVDPDSSFIMGRRLLLIMIGLLIGGRLF